MSDLKASLTEERNLLEEKRLKLKLILASDEINKMAAHQTQLLKIQYAAMVTYRECLDARIGTLP